MVKRLCQYSPSLWRTKPKFIVHLYFAHFVSRFIYLFQILASTNLNIVDMTFFCHFQSLWVIWPEESVLSCFYGTSQDLDSPLYFVRLTCSLLWKFLAIETMSVLHALYYESFSQLGLNTMYIWLFPQLYINNWFFIPFNNILKANQT